MRLSAAGKIAARISFRLLCNFLSLVRIYHLEYHSIRVEIKWYFFVSVNRIKMRGFASFFLSSSEGRSASLIGKKRFGNFLRWKSQKPNKTSSAIRGLFENMTLRQMLDDCSMSHYTKRKLTCFESQTMSRWFDLTRKRTQPKSFCLLVDGKSNLSPKIKFSSLRRVFF